MRPAILVACTTALLFEFVGMAPGAERRVPLLSVSKGQLPNDTALEEQTKLTIEEASKELDGKLLKVVYADGDSFGMSRGASERNWTSFAAVEFSAFNPSPADVNLSFAVRHRGTTGFQTRVDLPITLKPGKNDVRLSIDKMVNVSGSKPDLSNVMHWYLACQPGQTPTLYFSDFWLVGGDAHSDVGRIGNPSHVRSDPARLERIRAAKMPTIAQPVMFDTAEASVFKPRGELLR